MNERLTCLEPNQGLTLLIFFNTKTSVYAKNFPACKYGDALHELDQLIRPTQRQIDNVRIDERSWSHTSLPDGVGGLGLRQAVDVSLSAFVSSVHTTCSLYDDLTSRVNLLKCVCLAPRIVYYQGIRALFGFEAN